MTAGIPPVSEKTVPTFPETVADAGKAEAKGSFCEDLGLFGSSALSFLPFFPESSPAAGTGAGNAAPEEGRFILPSGEVTALFSGPSEGEADGAAATGVATVGTEAEGTVPADARAPGREAPSAVPATEGGVEVGAAAGISVPRADAGIPMESAGRPDAGSAGSEAFPFPSSGAEGAAGTDGAASSGSAGAGAGGGVGGTGGREPRRAAMPSRTAAEIPAAGSSADAGSVSEGSGSASASGFPSPFSGAVPVGGWGLAGVGAGAAEEGCGWGVSSASSCALKSPGAETPPPANMAEGAAETGFGAEAARAAEGAMAGMG